MPKTKFFFKFFPVMLITCNLWAVPFKVEVVKEGAGDTIRAGQLIQVHYKGFLLADLQDTSKVADTVAVADTAAAADSTAEEPTGPRPFADSYEAGEPLEFTIGMGQVIAGWDKGLMGMKVGEVRKLTVPFQMAYGENSLDGIPPYSDLYFEVELVHAEKAMEPDKFPASVDKLKWKDAAKGLKIYDEKVGTGKPATAGAVLKTHYTGWLLNAAFRGDGCGQDDQGLGTGPRGHARRRCPLVQSGSFHGLRSDGLCDDSVQFYAVVPRRAGVFRNR